MILILTLIIVYQATTQEYNQQQLYSLYSQVRYIIKILHIVH